MIPTTSKGPGAFGGTPGPCLSHFLTVLMSTIIPKGTGFLLRNLVCIVCHSLLTGIILATQLIPIGKWRFIDSQFLHVSGQLN